MGCFLTITAKDFAQLDATMRQAVSVVGVPLGDEITIQVSSTRYRNARQMAAMIRHAAPSAEVTSISTRDQHRARPTTERMGYELAALTVVAPYLVPTYVNKTSNSAGGAWNYAEGKLSEQIAGEILAKDPEFGLKITKITKSTGADLIGTSRGDLVVVEVKKSTSDGLFADLLGEGYGCRQCSDDWLQEVKINPKQVTVIGVQVNPEARTVTIYQRTDSAASSWVKIKQVPLQKSELARELYDL